MSMEFLKIHNQSPLCPGLETPGILAHVSRVSAAVIFISITKMSHTKTCSLCLF